MVSMEEISGFLQKGRARNVKQLVEQALEEGIGPAELWDALQHFGNLPEYYFVSGEIHSRRAVWIHRDHERCL